MDISSNKKRNSKDLIKPRRPFLLTLIFWILILWVILGWLRVSLAWLDRSLIIDLLPDWYFWYLLLAGLIWGLAGLPAIWGILRRASWTPTYIWIVGIIYPVIYWIERLLLWALSEDQNNWLFMLLLTGLWTGSIIWANTSKRVNGFFKMVRV